LAARSAIDTRVPNQRTECCEREWFLEYPGEAQARNPASTVGWYRTAHQDNDHIRRQRLNNVRCIDTIPAGHRDIQDGTHQLALMCFYGCDRCCAIADEQRDKAEFHDHTRDDQVKRRLIVGHQHQSADGFVERLTFDHARHFLTERIGVAWHAARCHTAWYAVDTVSECDSSRRWVEWWYQSESTDAELARTC
jgi:hypothetical protein